MTVFVFDSYYKKYYICFINQSIIKDMKIEAKDIKVGTKYRNGSTVQEVTEIVTISEKTIEYRTKRISPDNYGNFFQRKRLTTKIETI